MYLTREAAAYLNDKDKASKERLGKASKKEEESGDDKTKQAVQQQSEVLQEKVDAAPSGGTGPADDESGNDADAGNV